MKFKEMDKTQQDAFKEVLLVALGVRTQEEQKYTHELYRLLVLGNGTGIVLWGTFMGAVVQKGGQVSNLKAPLVLFFMGAFLAALVYFPLAAVANQATNYMTNQVTDFFLNKKNFEEITGYGLNRGGRVIVYLLSLSSLILFGIGVYKCISILGKFS